MYNFDDKVGIIRNDWLFLWILSMCKLQGIIHKLNIKPEASGFTQFVSDLPEFTHR